MVYFGSLGPREPVSVVAEVNKLEPRDWCLPDSLQNRQEDPVLNVYCGLFTRPTRPRGNESRDAYLILR
jgi:hypothetical protein